jgi:hypothetical protein
MLLVVCAIPATMVAGPGVVDCDIALLMMPSPALLTAVTVYEYTRPLPSPLTTKLVAADADPSYTTAGVPDVVSYNLKPVDFAPVSASVDGAAHATLIVEAVWPALVGVAGAPGAVDWDNVALRTPSPAVLTALTWNV